ncbi:MAG: PAS domain-containing protein, partial [Magnetococcales bacterium]|nr:PAS domain-containing protein [Magnetococcales bacterium]
MKIRTRATFHILPLVLLILAGTTLLHDVVYGYFLDREIHSRLRAVALIQKKRLDDILEWHTERVGLIASRSNLRQALSQYLDQRGDAVGSGVRSLLLEILHATPGFRKITLLNPAGQSVLSTDPGDVGIDHSKEDYFVRAHETVTVGDLFHDEAGELNGRLGGPLLLGRRFLGVLLVESRMHSLLGVVQDDTGLGRSGEAMLVQKSAKGELLRLTPSRFGHSLAKTPMHSGSALGAMIEAGMLGGDREAGDGLDEDGHPVLVFVQPLAKVDWSLVLKIDAEEMRAPGRSARDGAFQVLAGMGLVVFFLVTLLTRRLVRPLEEVSAAMQLVGREGQEQPVIYDRLDELGDLVAACNARSARLNDAHRRIQEKSRLLERQMGERERLERSCQESNLLLAKIFSNHHLLVAHLDSRGNFLRVNPLYAEAGGHPPEYFIGRNYLDLFPDPSLMAHLQQVLNTGKPWIAHDHPFEFPDANHASGRYWDCSLDPLHTPRGEVSGLIWHMLDVTRRKESLMALEGSEKRYRDLFENAPIPYWEEDLSQIKDLLIDLTNKGVED